MKKNGALIVGGIAVAATIAIYLLTAKDFFSYPMCWLCFSCMILLEAVTTVLYHTADNPRKVGAASVFLLETAAVIVLSLFYINIWIFSYTGFLTIFVILTALAAIAAYMILHHDRTAAASDAAIQSGKANMNRCRAVVNAMLCSEQGKAFAKELERLDEDLRFSNDSVVCEMDGEIYAKLNAMSAALGSEGYDAKSAIADVTNLIRQRKFIAK